VPALAFKIRNDLNDLAGVAVATTEFLESKGASPEVIFAANLAIEEMVSNTIKYGYNDCLEHQIEIQLLLGPNALEIEICDDGRPFDPCAYQAPPPSAVNDRREAGGLGIHFVRNILDSFNYVRRAGENVVRLTKRL
jgi:anti-sigma regulatory factor (Ser/Thr protein kinase)